MPTPRPIVSASSDHYEIALEAMSFAGYYLHDGSHEDPLSRMQRLSTPARGNLLLNLDILTTLAENVDTATRVAVHAARTAGHTWSEIGSQLGISKQAAQQKYGR